MPTDSYIFLLIYALFADKFTCDAKFDAVEDECKITL